MNAAFTIWLDGAAYCGEAEASERAPEGGPTGAWRGVGPETVSSIAFGGDAKRIEGHRNLGSHVERILRRARDGQLSFQEMTIRREVAP